MIPVDGTTSFGGDVLAVVVADREHARAPQTSLRWNTPSTRLSQMRRRLLPLTLLLRCGAPTQMCCRWRVCTDEGLSIEDALASSAHVVSETFTTQRIEHAFLEPESTLAVPSGDGEEKPYMCTQAVRVFGMTATTSPQFLVSNASE